MKKEKKYLWVTICMLILLSAFRLVSQVSISVGDFFLKYTEFPVVDFLSNLLFFWLLGLLWITYHHWKRATEYNHKLEDILSSISPDAIAVIDRNRKITMCSGQINSMFGMKPEKIIGKTTDILYFDRRLRGEKDEIANNLKEHGFHLGYATGKRTDGSTFPLEIITGVINGDKGAVILMRDITRRKNTEKALRESEARFELFMRYLPGYAFIKDAKGKYIYINRNCEVISGKKINIDILGKSDHDLLWPNEAKEVSEHDKTVLNENKDINYIAKIKIGDDTRSFITYKFPIEAHGGSEEKMIGGIAFDITEQEAAEQKQREIEKQMLQAQKLESLGILGGGIAHDFNNLLVGILGQADIAHDQLPENSPARKNIEEVISAAQRAADLANQILAYSGKGRFIVETFNISKLVEEMSNLLQVSISKKAKLILNLNKDIPPTKCDVTQIRQVIMNLIVNASDALEDNPGEISIKTGTIVNPSESIENSYLGESLPDGEYVYVTISDSGIGMDEKTCQRIFDPFFSTKVTGRGLGLAAVMGIIRSHNGSITLKSTPDEGTAFTFFLPVAEPSSSQKKKTTKTTEKWRGSGCILVADDENTVRQVAVLMLENMGFSVVGVSDGLKALAEIRDNPEKFCCVLLDITMPDMSGIETYHEIRKINSEIPIILSSGYNKQDEILHIDEDNHPLFLKKPYRLESIRNIVKTAVENQPDNNDK
jgi:PAS domain S-box-containing protein